MKKVFVFILLGMLVVCSFSCSKKQESNNLQRYKVIKKKNDVVIMDVTSGLSWIRDVPTEGMVWKAADKYCSELEYSGFKDWRLPTISELKTLVKGCKSGTKKCKVSTSCQNPKCMSNNCFCSENRGSGEDGFYWQKKVWNYKGDEMGSFWSSTIRSNHKFFYWGISFNNGGVDNGHMDSEFYVRCVR